jgi:hypothetical protein
MAMRRMLIGAVVLVCAGWPVRAHAQMQLEQIDDPPRLALFWELGGNALFSGNLDYLVAEHTSVRVGGFAFPLTDDSGPPWAAVLTVNQLFGDCGHYLEVGAGWVGLHRFGFDQNTTVWAPTATVGYRVQTRQRFLRVSLTAPAPRPNEPRHHAMIGLSYGRAF